MRTLFVLVLVIAGALAAAWLGGETWLAREAARRIEADPRIAAASVAPLREIDRIGLNLTGVTVDTAQGQAALPGLDLWAAPTAPTEFHASLPAEITLPVAGKPQRLGTSDGSLTVRIAPGSDMAVSRAAATSGPLTLNGAPLAQGVQIDARLTALGGQAPRAARASYSVRGQLDGLLPAVLGALPALADQGPVSAQGTAQLYLTAAVVPGGAEARLVGLNSTGVTLTIGPHSARIAAHLQADADNRATGAAFVYTPDPRGWLDLAASAGLIPGNLVMLAGTALETAAGMDVTLPDGVPAPAAPQDGELRIPLLFRDGRAFLGPMPLGPAPRFPA